MLKNVDKLKLAKRAGTLAFTAWTGVPAFGFDELLGSAVEWALPLADPDVSWSRTGASTTKSNHSSYDMPISGKILCKYLFYIFGIVTIVSFLTFVAFSSDFVHAPTSANKLT